MRLVCAFFVSAWLQFSAGAAATLINNSVPISGSTTPVVMADQTLVFPVDFTSTSARFYWDIPIHGKMLQHATTIELEICASALQPLHRFSVHVSSGMGWYAWPGALIPDTRWQRISLALQNFQTEGKPGPWKQARVLRLSAWRAADGKLDVRLRGLKTRSDTVAIVRASGRTAPGETYFSNEMADRCARLFDKGGIPFTTIDDSLSDLKQFRLIVLPYNPGLPPEQVAALRKFVAGKGRVMVFYNSNKALAEALGFRLSPWHGTEQGQGWSAWTPFLAGMTNRIPHFTTNVICPYPAAKNKNARIAATWVDEGGQESDLPACVTGPRGAWFAHIPPLAYPAAASFMRKLVSELDSRLPLNDILSTEENPLPHAGELPEIRGFWNAATSARHPGGWDGLLKIYHDAAFNTVFTYLGSSRLVDYDPLSSQKTQAQVADLLGAADRYNMDVHAWAVCWSLHGAPASTVRRLASQGRLMHDATGKPLPWLSPAHPQNRKELTEALLDMAKKPIQGLHLDYLRYPDIEGDYSKAMQTAFEKHTGLISGNWPASVLPAGENFALWKNFRVHLLDSWLQETQKAIRAVNKDIILSAAVYPDPDSAARQGQMWPAWLEDSLLDFVTPMIYTESSAYFAIQLQNCLTGVNQTRNALVPGLGIGADDCQLDRNGAIEQINIVREYRLRGFACFHDDESLRAMLPGLLE